MSKITKGVLYCLFFLLYGGVLTAVLLYYRFPEEKFKQYFIEYVEQAVPGMHCSIAGLSLGLPFSIVFSEITLTEGSNKKAGFTVEELRITPKISYLFEKYVIYAKISKGTVETIFSLDSDSKKYTLNAIKIAKIQLEGMPALEKVFNRKLSGTLAATGNYSAAIGEPWFKGRGEGKTTVTNGSLQFRFPVLSLDVLNLQKVQTGWKIDKSVMTITKGVLVGKELKGVFSGRMQFGSSFTSSRLNIQGNLTPLPPLLKKSKQAQEMLRYLHQQKKGNTLPFRLDGMVITPTLHLGNTPKRQQPRKKNPLK